MSSFIPPFVLAPFSLFLSFFFVSFWFRTIYKFEAARRDARFAAVSFVLVTLSAEESVNKVEKGEFLYKIH